MHRLVLLWYRCKTRSANRVQVTGCAKALFNPETSIATQKRHPYPGTLSSETCGDIKNAFLHCGDVLDVRYLEGEEQWRSTEGTSSLAQAIGPRRMSW